MGSVTYPYRININADVEIDLEGLLDQAKSEGLIDQSSNKVDKALEALVGMHISKLFNDNIRKPSDREGLSTVEISISPLRDSGRFPDIITGGERM